MDKEEYYKRIERINNRFKTDRVSADEEYQLVCQRNYLSTKYIEHLEQQCKKQKEVINKAVEYIKNKGGYCEEYKMTSRPFNTIELDNLLQILEDKEVSE